MKAENLKAKKDLAGRRSKKERERESKRERKKSRKRQCEK